MNTNNILLESGTGEVEILEFIINNKFYAINIIKVKEVINASNLTKLPESHPAIAGLTLYRDKIITLIDLRYVLEKQHKNEIESPIILCEFNKIEVAFSIDSIVGVHRIKWEQITKPDDISTNSLVIGNIVLSNKIILMLDFEKIVTDISPSTGISEDRIVDIDYKDRSNVKLVLADDSPLIRKLLNDTLIKAGFVNLKIFNDGKQALDYLLDLVSKKGIEFMEDVQVLITDIEMPQMDGHTLTRKIKEHVILRKLPVVLFSSLITSDLKHKGEAVGADAQLSKPEIAELVSCIDGFTNKTS
ncbi:chemotaxis protein [Clostridium estertheticum]|uniref:Stage 0 sporulation protein A homolog n=2 Tax=Clostridium estertheticum TaxID=238834 RepID=A0A1J0GE41_9CLOT|nr:chemotaxis protein [Clostridium estertheticum]APC39555.1 chemotaxis protein CheV [Clostridium estertheticum subsp. estertheticum]MBU3184608.1 chemotaxis protein [Clostridium estertheticum]MBZ9614414.1 chemotaxis protein [Clostridium estertheticum subsp. laramiense]MPQ30846.1 chemotaxis signal transduction protein CheV [Clostridium estertheticum]MPQ61522.1 chemotaxis signal transduction protein CheV [Clostridium estertheticum]